jgi:hypothetical protein
MYVSLIMMVGVPIALAPGLDWRSGNFTAWADLENPR